ncbi:unnamed protein product, partial [Protopolystoma xenopodis]
MATPAGAPNQRVCVKRGAFRPPRPWLRRFSTHRGARQLPIPNQVHHPTILSPPRPAPTAFPPASSVHNTRVHVLSGLSVDLATPASAMWARTSPRLTRARPRQLAIGERAEAASLLPKHAFLGQSCVASASRPDRAEERPSTPGSTTTTTTTTTTHLSRPAFNPDHFGPDGGVICAACPRPVRPDSGRRPTNPATVTVALKHTHLEAWCVCLCLCWQSWAKLAALVTEIVLLIRFGSFAQLSACTADACTCGCLRVQRTITLSLGAAWPRWPHCTVTLSAGPCVSPVGSRLGWWADEEVWSVLPSRLPDRVGRANGMPLARVVVH